MLETLNNLGKYPEARQALKMPVRLSITSGGRFFAIGQVMPEGPGARRGVCLSSRETSSSSTGVVRKCRGSNLAERIALCGRILGVLAVILFMCVTLGSCRGRGWDLKVFCQCVLKTLATWCGSEMRTLSTKRYSNLSRWQPLSLCTDCQNWVGLRQRAPSMRETRLPQWAS